MFRKHRHHLLLDALDKRNPFLRKKEILDYESNVRMFLGWNRRNFGVVKKFRIG